MLADVAEFLSEFDGMYADFRQRSQRVRALLEGRHTRFVVITTPTKSSLREAKFFVDRLAADRMPLGGVLLNRSHPAVELDVPSTSPDPLARAALRRYAELRELAEREEGLVDRILTERGGASMWRVQDLIDPVEDLDDLRRLGESIAAG